jgi:hypothetical protein
MARVVSSIADSGICPPGVPTDRQRPTTMDRSELNIHITAAAQTAQPESLRGLSARLVAYCWPGGQDDRYLTATVPWLRQWGPMRSGAAIPVCSCESGYCDVCN